MVFEASLRYDHDRLLVERRNLMLKTQFGRRLRYLRRQRDLTQEQLAEALGVSTEFISNMERGVNAPSFKTLEELAAALGVPVRDLFDFDPPTL